MYIAANKVFRTDDRGDSWTVISEDITRKLSRDKWPVMGRYWSVDGVAKNVSTSLYGMAVSLTESSIKEDLLYVGTDDGVIQISENAGQTWSKIFNFKNVPEYTYVSDILASKHNENVVYASFDNRKRDDFKAYILKSSDKGKTWKSISSNLPKNGTVHTLEQDHLNPKLLFAGTEFGVFFSTNEGSSWTQLKSGLPTISVRDMVIHKRENDLVLATFGRGFYILDDYTPLRDVSKVTSNNEAHIFPIKEALLYIQKNRGGYGYGSMPYKAKNAPYGATFTYFLKEVPKTQQATRRKVEKALIKSKSPIPSPTPKELYKEKNELAPYLLFSITDLEGNEVRKFTTKAKKGINRVTWDLRYLWDRPIRPSKEFKPTKKNSNGILVLPGTYQVKMDLVHNSTTKELIANQKFEIKRLDNTTLPAKDAIELAAFQVKLKELARITWGTNSLFNELTQKLNSLEHAALATTNLPEGLLNDVQKVKQNLLEINWQLNGEQPKASYEEIQPAAMTINSRLNSIIYVHTQSTGNITKKQIDGYQILKEKLVPLIEELNRIATKDIQAIEKTLSEYKAPWTTGKILKFKE